MIRKRAQAAQGDLTFFAEEAILQVLIGGLVIALQGRIRCREIARCFIRFFVWEVPNEGETEFY